LDQFFRYLIKSNKPEVMSKEVIYSSEAPEPIGPYSQAIKVGNTLYVSGQIPIDTKSGEIISGDIIKETEQVMKNIKVILEAAGMNFSDVVKCSIFLNNMSNFPKVNEAYGKSFTSNPPARETVEVSKLPKGVNIEISCIAVK
jgi:2-iminobutanoate/2-iminopropanoate deaminase